jgi:hypothetical protein
VPTIVWEGEDEQKTNYEWRRLKANTCYNFGKVQNLKGLSHEIDFKNFDYNLQNLAYLRDAAGF